MQECRRKFQTCPKKGSERVIHDPGGMRASARAAEDGESPDQPDRERATSTKVFTPQPVPPALKYFQGEVVKAVPAMSQWDQMVLAGTNSCRNRAAVMAPASCLPTF